MKPIPVFIQRLLRHLGWPALLPPVSLALSLCPASHADTECYRHTFFDNSLTPESYFYSHGRAVQPSFLQLQDGRAPIDSRIFFTPPNALRISWQSNPGGSWELGIRVIKFRDREILFDGDTLDLWLYSPSPISGQDLPAIQLLDTNRHFSRPVRLGDFVGALNAGRWTGIRIPLSKFPKASVNHFNPHRLEEIIFSQGRADEAKHTLFLDEIRIDNSAAANNSSTGASALPAPHNLRAVGYARHVDLSWSPVEG